jgi:sirohydrochlorin ferrochelatase
VLPYFLLPGKHWHKDIPDLCAEAAARHAGICWRVTEPLGLSDKILEVVAERLGASK